MKPETVIQLHTQFQDASYNTEHGEREFWLARDLMDLLGYDDWKNFELVIDKAKTACANSGKLVSDHFSETGKMIALGKGGKREVVDFALDRYACYLVALNGNPSKLQVAFAQTYFATQTREHELLIQAIGDAERVRARGELRKSETELSNNIVGRTGDGTSAGRVRSAGDRALFNGKSTQEMKNLLGVPDGRPLADFLQTVIIKGKDFANEVTNATIKVQDLQTESAMTSAHVASNKEVRAVLERRGIAPETLPRAEDVKKVERRLKSDVKRLPGAVDKLPVPPADPTKS